MLKSAGGHGAACCWMAERMHFQVPIILHGVAFMVLDLALYTEYPDGMGGAVNIFIFLDLTPAAVSKAALLTRRWDDILGGGALMSFVDTSLLMEKQKVTPIMGWEAAAKQLETWGVVCADS